MRSLFTLTAIFILGFGTTVSAQGFWKSATTLNVAKSNERIYANPTHYHAYDLAFDKLRKYITQAPLESYSTKQKGLELEIPLPDGSLQTFYMFNSPSMESGLQAKYPSITSYKGYSKDKTENLRITVSDQGFFAAIASPSGTMYIDPVRADAPNQYYSYYIRDNVDENMSSQLSCGHTVAADMYGQKESNTSHGYLKVNSEPVEMRTYRFAVTTTAEWTDRNGGTQAAGLANVVMTVDRLNLIYENEVAIKLLLVNDNDKMVYTDPATDPFVQPEEGFVMLGENTGVINNAIGSTNYDFGHVYGLCTDTGGVARLASVCDPTSKGAGASCFMGDLISVTLSVVAHEIGHQMGAQHTFNNCTSDNMTLENESPSNAYEPGSGSTIMSYAGLCPLGNNVRGDNFDKYHVASLVQMKNFMFNGGGDVCATKIPTDNVSPEVTVAYSDGFTIPIMTPFELTCEASDANNDPILYSWEQFNIGTLSPLGMPFGNAPSFESLPPNENPSRTFPSLTTVVFNRNSDTEVLPEISRDFTFRVTARDNNPQGGGTSWQEVKFKSTDQAGPFEITFPTRVETMQVGDEITVSWDVANTDQAPVNCQKVDIHLSVDGGFNFDKALAINTPNDGSEIVYVPNRTGEDVRIRVSAADNIFFDMSNLDSKIVEPSAPDFYVETGFAAETICLPASVDIPITTASLLGYNDQIEFSVVDGLPPGATASFQPQVVSPSENTQLRIDMSNADVTGDFQLNVRATSGGITHDRIINLSVVSNNYSDLLPVAPANNLSEVVVLPTFEWTPSSAASSYTIEVATSPSFGESVVSSQSGIVGSSYVPSVTLDAGNLYYWRLIPSNQCSTGPATPIQVFHTVALACADAVSIDTPQNISASGTREVTARIPLSGGTISDMNVKQVVGTHERVSDLKFTLTSPSGTSVVLANRKCGNSSNFNIGFDDQAPSTILCPISSGTSFQPEEALSAFNGESAEGIWELKVEDLAPGSGGQLTEVSLENCGAVSVQNPFIVVNDVHMIPPAATARISNDILLVDDNNNSANELTYTVVTLPQHGDLVLNEGAPMPIGATYTQSDVNNGRLRYIHDGGASTADNFNFVVQDGEGGWISITQFLIDINADHVTSTDELQATLGLSIYPNPVQDQLVVTSDQPAGDNFVITLRDIQGRLIAKRNGQGMIQEEFNVKQLDSGIYFLSISDGQLIYTEKVIVE